MITIREAKVKVAQSFLSDFYDKMIASREKFYRTGQIDASIHSFIINAPLEIVELLENEEVLHAEREHEWSLENAYKS